MNEAILDYERPLSVLSSFITYHRIWNYSNMMGTTVEAETAFPSETSEFIHGFQWGLCYLIFNFMCGA